ncbi:MAG: DMT family transporter [Acidobacteria bacterium]|jgi:drug/metabolite transporter (DMT)-like permease|nr:DMT family transporter [Acidobacteriota bacterium]
MSRRGWFLFILVGFLWGIPYLFIKVAVDPENGFSPAIVVCLRTAIGAAILIPFAIKQKQLIPAIRGIKYVSLYALLEMIGPWILIGTAEQKISSGLAGLLVASVPIWATIFASMRGDKSVWHHTRLIGIIVGFIGLIAVVGIESITGSADPLSIGMVLVAAIGYSYAVMMVQTALPDVSGIAINAVAMALTAIFYLPWTLIQWPEHHISMSAINAVIGLGVLSTGAAFVAFFALTAIIGVARGSLVTYLNTAFAVVLGVIILSEPLTFGIIIGLPLVLIGSYLASRKPASTQA